MLSDGVDNRLARKFGAVYAAGALASEAKIIAWSVADIKEVTLKCYQCALSYRAKLLPSWEDARKKLLMVLHDPTKFARRGAVAQG